jgi:hypothetical protein
VVGRHFDDLDAVLEFDTLDDLWQLVFSACAGPRRNAAGSKERLGEAGAC